MDNSGNLMDGIIAYEEGLLSEEEVIDLFQDLVDNGMAWQLQGHYGRTAAALIEAGYVFPPLPKKPIDVDCQA